MSKFELDYENRTCMRIYDFKQLMKKQFSK